MIGAMRHQVKIQSQSRSANGGGSSAVSYSDVATVNASINPVGGGERLFGDQLEERITHKITIRFRRDVSFKKIWSKYFLSIQCCPFFFFIIFMPNIITMTRLSWGVESIKCPNSLIFANTSIMKQYDFHGETY